MLDLSGTELIVLLELEHFIMRYDIEIFTVSETWLSSSVLNKEINVPGTRCTGLTFRYKRRGGVCAYLCANLKSPKYLNVVFINFGCKHNTQS